MKRIALAAVGLGSAAFAGFSPAAAQFIPGQVAQGQPGWSCSGYKFIPDQQWTCAQWTFLGDNKLTPPPGFTEKAAVPAKKAQVKHRKTQKKRRR